jgi:branched-chain amino acid transport system substrate-binding protein
MKVLSTLMRVAVVLLFLSVCLAAPGTILAQDKTEILIGAPISMTGPNAMNGIEQDWAYRQALDDYNKANGGGILVKEAGKKIPIKFVFHDDESDPGKAQGVMERLIRMDKVDLLLSEQYDFMVYPTAMIAEKYKKYYHATVCWPESYLEGNFKWSTDLFGNPTEMSTVPFEIWRKQLPKEKWPKRIGLFMMDNPPGQIMTKRWMENGPKYGYDSYPVVEPFPFSATDYSALILKAKAKKVDAIMILSLPPDAITFIRQMKELGFSVPYMHGWAGTWPSEFAKALGADSDYILADGFWSKEYPYSISKELGERYYKKFNKDSVSIGLFYSQAMILFQAIEMAGTVDSKTVRDTVMENEWKDTLVGDVKYNEQGYAAIPSVALQWWKGEQKLVRPFFPGGWQLKLAPPWNER